jgi:hypothetical protein
MTSMAIMSGMTSIASENEFGADFNTFFSIRKSSYPRLYPRFRNVMTLLLISHTGWLDMTWFYPAETTNLRIRIQANAHSTCSN